MKIAITVALCLFTACLDSEPTESTDTADLVPIGDQPPPTQYPKCSALGCSSMPSSRPDIWAPCGTAPGTVCYCYQAACVR